MSSPKAPSLLDALIPLLTLIVLLVLCVYLFGSDATGGPTQIVLILGAAVAALVAVRNGHPWPEIQKAIVAGIGTAMGAIMILLMVGALIGAWLISGTVPSLIYYGLELLDPKFFFVATCLVCSITSLATGSSWTTAGTLGVALIGVAMGLGLSPAIAAGAVVSGAYFGDKMSPLSDTTNLAPAVAGSDLFEHIRHMAWTTVPSYLIALVLFLFVGFGVESSATPGSLEALQATLDDAFNISVWTLLPLVLVLWLAARKKPPLPTILAGALFGAVIAAVMQPQVVLSFADAPETWPALALIKGVWLALANGYVSATGVAAVDELLSRGGMSSMLSTIWLVLAALAFGAVMEHAGMLERLIRATLKAAKSTGSLIATVATSAIGMNIVAADQYIAIVIPGRMFKAEFERRNLEPKNLSRTLEDAGTMTSALVPWNTCGAYMAATLGVATVAYLPFAFFNLLNPLIAIFYGFTGISIKRIEPAEGEQQAGTQAARRLADGAGEKSAKAGAA
ncbi:MAG TPA: Na+/H+ antiporter NhaC [Woeseiaceae bacterium]|nr:Na+/H+ antiporter NhaC [Woeseiaceae bacterium]